jgi:hypothetical protein
LSTALKILLAGFVVTATVATTIRYKEHLSRQAALTVRTSEPPLPDVEVTSIPDGAQVVAKADADAIVAGVERISGVTLDDRMLAEVRSYAANPQSYWFSDTRARDVRVDVAMRCGNCEPSDGGYVGTLVLLVRTMTFVDDHWDIRSGPVTAGEVRVVPLPAPARREW